MGTKHCYLCTPVGHPAPTRWQSSAMVADTRTSNAWLCLAHQHATHLMPLTDPWVAPPETSVTEAPLNTKRGKWSVRTHSHFVLWAAPITWRVVAKNRSEWQCSIWAEMESFPMLRPLFIPWKMPYTLIGPALYSNAFKTFRCFEGSGLSGQQFRWKAGVCHCVRMSRLSPRTSGGWIK